jgi:N-glycosylase/DNA lyase
MRKFGLVAKERQANSYRKMAQATQENQTCDNLPQRQFNQGEPEKVVYSIKTIRYEKRAVPSSFRVSPFIHIPVNFLAGRLTKVAASTIK